jgi:uncharacterized repeat protein (TIGR01451 family)
MFRTKNYYMSLILVLGILLSILVCGGSAAAQSNNTTHKTSLNDSKVIHNNSILIKKLNIVSDSNKSIDSYNVTKNLTKTPIAILPSYYDLRLLGKLTPVGDQGSSGVCWAFASLGSLESCLLPNETWNFSENNMKNILSVNYPQGFDREANDAGSWEEATAYLTSYNGPVTSTQDPFNEYSSYSPSNLTIVKHVQDTVILDPRNSTGTIDNNRIKDAIMEYGAVYSLMSYDDFYLNPLTNGYYYNGSLAVNHAVDIVGWDDNYSKDNFFNDAPGNGAFIVSNSWGSGWGDNGYFYVSYYDKYLASSDYNVVFMDAEPTSNYDNIYQYDPYGAVGSLGYDDDVGWFSNIFKSNGNEKLEASSFYVFSPNSTYKMFVYLNPSSNNPSSGVLVDSQTGIISSEGYKTIKLDKVVQLLKGQKFSVVVELTSPNNSYPITIEYPLAGYSSKATAKPGESYVSEFGKTWQDLTNILPNANVCLKAFTVGKASDLVINETIKKIKDSIHKAVTLTINVQNKGPGESINTIVKDKLPPELTYISYVCNYGTYNAQTGIWNVGTLPSGALATLIIRCFLNQGFIITNKAIVSSSTYDPDMSNNMVSLTKNYNDISLNVINKGKFCVENVIPMQKTGIPVIPLVMGLIILMGGFILIKKS